MRRNKEKLIEVAFEKKFGSLYSDLRPFSENIVYYSALFCMRRLMIAVAVIFLKD